MRIEGSTVEGEDPRSSTPGFRPSIASPLASTLSHSSTDEMGDTEEGAALQARVQELEKKVLDQTDEITCLRSTLADVLRRVASMETGTPARAAPNGVRSTPSPSPGVTAPTGVRVRTGVSDKARDPNRRATSYISGRGAQSPRNNGSGQRRSQNVYQSNSSLYSDGQSSSSASPVPSPSPTHPQLPTTPTLSSLRTTTARVTTQSYSASHTVTRLTNTAQSLTKRWNSSQDFSVNSCPVPGHSGPGAGHNGPGTGHSGAGTGPTGTGQNGTTHQSNGKEASASSSSSSNLLRRQNGGSLHNLTALRHSYSGSPTPLRPGCRRDPVYLADEGIVRVYVRGRPVTLCVPSHLRDTYTPATPAPPPPARLLLDWVYGYRGRDCRNNLQQLPTGELVYFVAAVAVLCSPDDRLQRHYLGHTDDIRCLAVHPNRVIVATGQTAGNNRTDTRSWRLNPPPDPTHPSAEAWPHIRVWDSVSLNTLHILGIADFERSVTCLAFSRADGGGLLVAVDDAADHNLSVWDWGRGERGLKLLESKCSSDPVLAVEFSPVDRSTFITCGRGNITFWTHEHGMLAKRLGVFASREKPKYVTAVTFLNTGDVLSGDSSGNLVIWFRGGNTVAHSVRRAHAGPVFSLLVQNNGHVLSASKDGLICEWDSSLNRTGNVLKVPDKYGAPRVVTNGRGARLVVGTTRNCILAGSFALPLAPVVVGHSEEVWALACHPHQQQFLTGGYDKSCVLWDSMSHSQVWTTNFTEAVQCGSFSPCGGVVAVGGVSGYWAAMDAATRQLRQENRDGTHPIQVLKFSPDGQYLAVGSRDGNIYMYQVMDDLTRFARIGKCQGHASAVLHLDWSTDSQYLQSNSTDYDILFWNAAICRQIVQSSQLRDVQWATRTCPVSFHSFGVWLDDGVDVLSTCQARTSDVIVAGDFLGNVTLLSSPACHQKASGVPHQAHGSLVTNVEFLPDDTRLVTCGSRDAAVMQWQLVSRP